MYKRQFLNQAASSHEQRLETHRNILARLVALTERSQAFLKALEMEVDARYQEGTTRFLFLNSLHTMRLLITWLPHSAGVGLSVSPSTTGYCFTVGKCFCCLNVFFQWP